jgi:hypothetical protein
MSILRTSLHGTSCQIKSINFTVLALVGFLSAEMPLHGQMVAVDLSHQQIEGGIGGAAFAFYVGWQFNVNSPVLVSDLGLYTGNLNDHSAPAYGTVGLWDSSGALLASVYVQPSDPPTLGFNYQQVPSVLLNAGQSYTIAAFFVPDYGMVDQFAIGTVGAIVAPQLSYDAPVFAFATSGSLSGPPIGNGWPTPLTGDGFFAASFEFTPIPEPSTVTLLGLGVAAMMACRRFLR